MGDSVPTPWGPRPADWPLVRWGSFASRAGVPVRVENGAREKQVTVRVRHQGVQERRISPHRRQQIQTLNQFRIRAEQFIISKIDARNGACGFVPPDLDGAIVTQDFPVYDIRDADPRYLDHLVALPVFWRLCESVSDGTTNRVRLDLNQFENLRFPFPPLSEQRGIAAVLDAVDETIEQTEAVIAATKEVRKAVLNDLLTRGVPGWHSEWKQAPGLGTIPACWDVVTLGAVCRVTSGFAMGPHRLPRDRPRPYLTVANVQSDRVTMKDHRYMELTDAEYESRSLREGDLVMVEGHAQLSQLGRAALVPQEAAGFTFQNHLFRVRLTDEGDLRYICAVVNGPVGRSYFASFGGTTSGLNTVSAGNVRLLRLPWPNAVEQKCIGDSVAAVDAQLAELANSRAAIRDTKAALAEALLTGEVRVKPRTEAL